MNNINAHSHVLDEIMNTTQRITLLALLSLMPFLSHAKSPWDREPATPVEPVGIAAEESVMAEPVAAEPIPAEANTFAAEPIAPVEPVAAEPIAPIEPVAEQPTPVEPAFTTATPASETIEVIETSGDVLAMPQPTTSQADASPVLLLEFPRRGMDQDKVQSELGAPVEVKDAVGQPPITRWIYNDRVVYFERSTVIHVVAR
jgi:hypothetical protein